MTITNEEISQWLFELFLRREGLADFEDPMFALASLCRSRDEFDLLMHSVEKLVALSQRQFFSQIDMMAKYIRENVLNDQPTAVVAMAWGGDPDSSQLLVQCLKPIFRKENNIKFFNSVNAYEKKGYVEIYPRFILVDEFAGTGATVENRLVHIINHAKSVGIDVEPFVCLLFGMEKAAKYLCNQGRSVHFCTKLKAGISGYFSGEERDTKIALMKRIEEELADRVDGVPLPSLGRGEAEALFFIKDRNAPNSNFPIFWWPIDRAGNERPTVMHRAEL